MPPLWGDGFAGDGLAATLSMADWDSCSADEYAVLFPRLLPSDRLLPPVLRAHLETCVAARAWRLARLDPGSPALDVRPRRAASPATASRTWFGHEGIVEGLMYRVGLLRTTPERAAAERRLLALLDAILDCVRRGDRPTWSADREAWFAFGFGVHPAYLWPESAISADRGFTAAWLGHLDRGRAALMPPSVAEYLLGAVLDAECPRDRALAAMTGTPEDARRLRRAAAARLDGADPVVAFGRGRLRGGAMAGGTRPAAFARDDALEHA